MSEPTFRRHILLLGMSVGIAIFFATLFFFRPIRRLFRASSLTTRAANRVVQASGYLEVKDSMRIGSLVPGIIKEMLVEENEVVTKGQLIAIVDDGKEDAEVRQTKAVWERAKAKLCYTEKFFVRQELLFKRGYISEDAFDAVTRDYEQAVADVAIGLGAYDKARIEFDNKSIKAPADGIVIAKVSREGETVTLASPATIIYTIAKDIKEMVARLEVEEDVVGYVRSKMEVTITVNAYSSREFTGVIRDVSRAPVVKNGSVYYVATVALDNSELLFHPGMTLESYITVGNKMDALVLPCCVFDTDKKKVGRLT